MSSRLAPETENPQTPPTWTSADVWQFELGRHQNFVYAVLDVEGRRAALVDLHTGFEAVTSRLAEHGYTVAELWITHTHWDHVAGLKEFARDFPHVTILVHPLDAHRLPAGVAWKPLTPGPRAWGSLAVLVLHTPGHSPGECCFALHAPGSGERYLLTGDTLFLGNCGRTDLEGGSTPQMFESLTLLRAQDPGAWVLPGHHYYVPDCARRLGEELQSNPALRCLTVEELEALP